MKKKSKLRGTLIKNMEISSEKYSCPVHSKVVLYIGDRLDELKAELKLDKARMVIPPSPKVCAKCKEEGRVVYSYYKHECRKYDKT